MRKTFQVSVLTTFLLSLPAIAGGETDGAPLFKSNCAICHGADGRRVNKAMNQRDLTSSEVQALADEKLADAIANGRNKMPAFKNKLTGQQIQALVAHLRALAAPQR